MRSLLLGSSWMQSNCIILADEWVVQDVSFRDQYLSVCQYIRHYSALFAPTWHLERRREMSSRGMRMCMKYIKGLNSDHFQVLGFLMAFSTTSKWWLKKIKMLVLCWCPFRCLVVINNFSSASLDEFYHKIVLICRKIIWLGDLNYRINLSYEKARELISKREWSKLAEQDQVDRN